VQSLPLLSVINGRTSMRPLFMNSSASANSSWKRKVPRSSISFAVQGAFREVLVCRESQAHSIGEGMSLQEAAMAEPLAVALHATRRAGSLIGKRVLVSGAGPIGTLVAVAARRGGAAEIVVTDIADGVLAFASKVGADRVINVARDTDALKSFAADKDTFDAHFEASGAEAALRAGIDAVRPRGVIVQLGLGGEMTRAGSASRCRRSACRGTGSEGLRGSARRPGVSNHNSLRNDFIPYLNSKLALAVTGADFRAVRER
jgi:threonine dehydrogenase-like Zn-dependent dehydrogenase